MNQNETYHSHEDSEFEDIIQPFTFQTFWILILDDAYPAAMA